MPQFGILHGDSDVSVPPHIAEEFADELQVNNLAHAHDLYDVFSSEGFELHPWDYRHTQ